MIEQQHWVSAACLFFFSGGDDFNNSERSIEALGWCSFWIDVFSFDTPNVCREKWFDLYIGMISFT